MTLKELIYSILLNKPETRNSRDLLRWEVLKEKGYVYRDTFDGNEYLTMSKEQFMKNKGESVRRCSQQLQRSDRLLGKWSVQPSKEVEKHRKELASLNGYNFIEGQSTFV